MIRGQPHADFATAPGVWRIWWMCGPDEICDDQTVEAITVLDIGPRPSILRSVEVDHVIIYRWVQRFTALFLDAARPGRHATC